MSADAGPSRKSPYKGLMPYDESDADFFFGRTREVRLVVANLFAAPATVLLGASGVGKSSMLRAGVLSELATRSNILPVICSSWRDEPSAQVRHLLGEAMERARIPAPPTGVRAGATLRDEVRLLSRRANRHIMIILDQFEEFFLYHPPSHPFLDELADAVNSSALAQCAAPYGGTDDADDEEQDSLRAHAGRLLHSLEPADQAVAMRLIADALASTPPGAAAPWPAESEARREGIGRQLEMAGLLHRGETIRGDRAAFSYVVGDGAVADGIRRWLADPDPVASAVAAWLESPAPSSASYLLSLREDALAKLDLFEGRIPDLMQRLLRLESLNRDGAREAIVSPLQVYNERRADGQPSVVAEPELVETVLRQVGRGRIVVSDYTLGARPLQEIEDEERIDAAFLQLVMTRLWDEEQLRGSPVLRAATLDDLHGAESIVRSHLDQVMNRFSEADQQVASRVFRYLITQSGAKVAHAADDLAGYAAADRIAVERLLTQLSSGTDRILRPVPAAPERPQSPRFEIFHDRLGQAILGWLSRFDTKEASIAAARTATISANSPVSKVRVFEAAPDEAAPSSGGIALSLSGGGFRGMLFHLGAVWRLNELGLLPTLDQISSVSSGSLIAATLGMAWSRLAFDEQHVARAFGVEVVEPLRRLATTNIDVADILLGMLVPGQSAADRLRDAFDDNLFHGTRFDVLPHRPRIVLVASNMQSGAVWRFSRSFVGDYTTGRVVLPQLTLAMAAACSAAQPPVFSPVRIDLSGAEREAVGAAAEAPDTYHGVDEVFLTDGAILDRLAIETVWKQHEVVLVSDGSGRLSFLEEPPTDWARQSIRVLEMVDWQARSLQKRQLIESYANAARRGTYWGIGSSLAHYGLDDAVSCPPERTAELARIPARFKALPDRDQEDLINWGYAACDAAVRRHYQPDAKAPERLPYRSESA